MKLISTTKFLLLKEFQKTKFPPNPRGLGVGDIAFADSQTDGENLLSYNMMYIIEDNEVEHM